MSDQQFWALCFAQIVGIQFHPANRSSWTELDLRQFADVCDVMLEVYRSRFEKER